MSEWWPAEHFLMLGEPEPKLAYPDFPLIEVRDIVPKKLRRKRKTFWRDARDRAFEPWINTGVKFYLIEAEPGYIPGRLTLDLQDIPPGIGGWAVWDEPPEPDGGPSCPWVQIDSVEFENCFQAKARNRLVGIIRHEVGHTLGFGHGGDGVMAVPRRSNSLSAEEIAVLRQYWF